MAAMNTVYKVRTVHALFSNVFFANHEHNKDPLKLVVFLWTTWNTTFFQTKQKRGEYNHSCVFDLWFGWGEGVVGEEDKGRG